MSEASDYFVLRLRNANASVEDWLTLRAFDYGALGTSEALSFTQPEGEEDVFTVLNPQRTIDVYFGGPPSRDLLEALQSRFPEVKVDVTSEKNRDWMAEWKKSFQPFPLVGDHWVVPSWCEPPAAAKHKIWIDPGMAFGTGTHATTQLVSEALVQILKSGERVTSLLDVGTGTGILAILARQLGVAQLSATEIEPEARRVAHENFERNGVADVSISELQVGDLTQSFDIVVANIIDGVLVRLREDLLARVKPGGWLVLSGIITERESVFLSGFELDRPWSMREQKGDWLLYAVRL